MCRSKTEWVYGFKVALVMSPEGVVTAFFLASAACGERPIGEALIAEDRHGTGRRWEARSYRSRAAAMWQSATSLHAHRSPRC